MKDKTEIVKPFFDSAIWSAIPSLAWVLLMLGLIWWWRLQIRGLLAAFESRLKSGSALKIGFVEIGASSGVVAAQGTDFTSEDSQRGIYPDDDRSFGNARDAIYLDNRNVMLVHRLQRASSNGHSYDILIYVVPHKDASLAAVTKVEYFFGSFWKNKVYPSTDRSRGFPVVTSAYGTFLCLAKIHFNDGETREISRYIDFEMGALAAQRAAKKELTQPA